MNMTECDTTTRGGRRAGATGDASPGIRRARRAALVSLLAIAVSGAAAAFTG